MNWFCALNRGNEEKYIEYITMYTVAVLSALETNPQLKMNLIFSGERDEHIDRVEKLGVNVINFDLSFSEDVKLAYDGIRRSIALGTFLRIDLPKICDDMGIEDDYVLYTDCDVMFLKDISDIKKSTPKYFSVAGEFSKEIIGNAFNAGVMWINLKNMYEDYINFRFFIKNTIPNLPAYDQGAYRIYYSEKFDYLDYKYNFKPYWPEEDDIAIFHFHGPKPLHIDYIDTHKHKSLAGPLYFKMTELFNEKLNNFENG